MCGPLIGFFSSLKPSMIPSATAVPPSRARTSAVVAKRGRRANRDKARAIVFRPASAVRDSGLFDHRSRAVPALVADPAPPPDVDQDRGHAHREQNDD